MKIWALADLHLAISVPSKTMEVFGPAWHRYMERIAENWRAVVQPDDLVLIPGDICWAMRLDEAVIDLKWIDALPGTKVILRGNHDYWWSSASKMAKVMPPSIHFIHNSVFNWNGVTIGGSRLWDSHEYQFGSIVQMRENPLAAPREEKEDESEKIFVRELERLKLSLSQLDPKANLRIAMTHYPPIGLDLKPSRASQILEEYKIDICLFGHLHNIAATQPLFGEARGVEYLFTSCDYLNFHPLQVRS
jgi:predicted phosphohydrolase